MRGHTLRWFAVLGFLATVAVVCSGDENLSATVEQGSLARISDFRVSLDKAEGGIARFWVLPNDQEEEGQRLTLRVDGRAPVRGGTLVLRRLQEASGSTRATARFEFTAHK